jgi:CBS domain-containing protein
MTTPTVADVMTRAVAMAGTMTPHEEIVAVLDRLGIGGVPIVDEVGRPLGFVSDRDLRYTTRSSLSLDIGVWLDWMPAPERRGFSTDVAAHLMSAPPPTVTPQTSLHEAARLILAADHRRLLVVDTAGRLIGIVTRSDLLRGFLDAERRAGEGNATISSLARERDGQPVNEQSLA